MGEKVLLGVGKRIVPIPYAVCKTGLLIGDKIARAIYTFYLSETDHRIRNFVTLELIRTKGALSPEYIAESLSMPVETVRASLAKLSKKTQFIAKNEKCEVTWSYPVTVDQTKHKAVFSTGESIYSP